MVNSRRPLAHALAVCVVCIPLAGQTTATIDINTTATVPQQFATMAEANYAITISVNGVSSPPAVNTDPAAQLVIPIQH
jgi:hypothetical protein